MRQLNHSRHVKSGRAAIYASLALAACAVSGFAVPRQAAPTGDNTKVLLIAEKRSAGEAAHRDEVNALLKETLSSVFKQSDQYTVHVFSPNMPLLKRALLTKALEPGDLDEPLKPSSLHKIAGLLGARYILTFHAVHDKTGIKTDIAYEEIAAQNTWRTVLSDSMRTPPVIGRRKLKLEEMVDVNVDTIAKNFGVNSHLMEDLHLEIALAPVPGVSQPANSGQPTKSVQPSASATSTTAVTAGKSQSDVTVGTDAGQAPPVIDESANINAKPSKHSKGKGKKNDPIDLKNALNVPDEQEVTVNDPRNVQHPLTTPGFEENVSNLERAQRYRRSGDLPTTILYLRRAVDDKPEDVEVRRQLIQAYQDASEPDLAVEEIGRSLRLDGKNATLYRLYGNARLEAGNIPDAITAYNKAIEADPNDVLARVALGDAMLRDGQFNAGLKAYIDAAAAAPNNPLPHRKLGRAACQKAASDISRYKDSLDEIKKSRTLTPTIDTQSYNAEYVALMKIMESRMMDILDQVDSTYTAYARGQSKRDETIRNLKDMSERATAAADFLDGLPVAAGQEPTHALYQEGTASVVSSISYLKQYVDANGDASSELKLKTERMSARHDLTAAGVKLRAKPSQ